MCGNSCVTFFISCVSSSAAGLAPKRLCSTSSMVPYVLLCWWDSFFLEFTRLERPICFTSLLFLLHNKKINLRLASSEWALRGVAQKGFNCVCFVKLIHLVLGGSTRRSPGQCCLLGMHLISATRGNWSLNSKNFDSKINFCGGLFVFRQQARVFWSVSHGKTGEP